MGQNQKSFGRFGAVFGLFGTGLGGLDGFARKFRNFEEIWAGLREMASTASKEPLGPDRSALMEELRRQE